MDVLSSKLRRKELSTFHLLIKVENLSAIEHLLLLSGSSIPPSSQILSKVPLSNTTQDTASASPFLCVLNAGYTGGSGAESGSTGNSLIQIFSMFDGFKKIHMSLRKVI